MDLPTLRSHYETLRKSSKEARDANDTKECWDLLMEYAREAVNSESDRVFVATLLFDRQNGIFAIIDQSLRSQGKLARQLHIDILAYITSLLEALGSTEGSPHAAFILEKCLHFFKRFELAAVKAATFGPILEILGWNAEVLLKLKLDPCGMAHSYQREYAVNKKLSNTVKGGILQVLGSIFDQFSEEFISGVQFDCEWLQRECLAVLEKSKTQNFPEAYVAGALSGLAATLIHEDGRNPEALRIGYDHIKRALQPSNVQAVHRYLGLRGAMKILTQCASEFGHTLTKDLTLLDYLVQLRSKHSNKMVRNSSEEALNAVFKQISKDLSSGAAISDFDPFDTTSRLLGILGDMMSGSNSDNRELMVAVSGIGHLAEPCKKFFGQQGLQKLLADLAPLVDAGHVLETIEDLQEAAVVSDMILLVALGRIVQSLDIVDHSTIEMCQNVVGRIIGSYLNLWPRQHQTVHDSIVQMLLSLQQHPLALQSMTQFFANILLTHTLRPPTGKIFSGPLAVNSPEEISRDGWSHYLKIWLAVLKREHLGEEAKAALEGQPPLGSTDSISTLTYDCLLRLILDALRNLDIGYDAVREDGVGQLDAGGVADETQVLAAEVGFGLQASNRDDMLTFMVLSDFTCTILRDCGPLAFQPWSQIVTVEVVAGSTKHPLLPGYYKMLTENVKLCHAMGMFDLSSQEDGIDAYVKQLCSGVFREYLLEVLVACRRYAGELLCSCLTLLLTSPALLLPSHQISTPVKLALSLGLQHPEVAYVALTALEAMETDGVPIKPTMILEILPSVVPYLRESIKIGDSKNNLDPRKKDYSDVEETQRRILLWLGRQGGIIHNMIGNWDSADGKQTDYDGANWDPEKRLGLKIEFPEMKQMSTIWLDAMIPQASMLAEASGDRSCRVSACELLHSVILWMVGTNAGRPMSRTDEDFQPVPTRFHKILKRLLPVALRLAVSPEPVAKQLFEPLIFTLIHWLTRSARREAAETMCLLDAIMVGLGDETSGALRELCARAAAEFLKWSAKHVPKQTTGDSHGNNLNAASLLRRLFDRLSHPQPYHRLGAALALGHCARVLRNEEDLMEDYALEALHYCVHALRIAEGDAMGSGTLKQTSHAVSAIVHHCITKCSQNLINENPNRAGFASIGVFLEWLWKKTICLEASCRRRCMLLHRKLTEAALQNEDRDMDVGPSGQWWKKYALATGQSERQLLHEFLHLSAGLSVSDSEPMSVSRLRLWLKSLDGALEWTVWALDEGIVSVDAVQALRSSLDERNVIAGLGAFFEFISDPSMVSSAEWGTTSPPLSGCDREAQDVAIAALDLLTSIDCTSLGFDPTHLNRFLTAALFAPGLIGLRPSDEKLHRRIALNVCSVIRASLATSSEFSTQLARSIGSFVSDVLSNRRETSTQLSQETWLEALGPVGAVTFCNGVSLLLGIFSAEGVPLLSPTEARDLPRQCLVMVMKMLSEGNMSHIEKQAAEGCVSLSIQLGLPATELLSVVLESEQSAKLYNAFPSVLHRWILFNAEMCCPEICSALCQQGPVSLTAEAMLAGTFDSLAHSEMISGRIDPLHASFRSCVLSSMGPCAVMLKNTDSQAFAKTMVRILKTLVGGGNGSWLSPTQAGYSSILDAFLALLALRDRKSAPIRSQALQLLPSFLAFQESADRIVTAVDSMVTDVFPSISSSMKRGSTDAREYAMQLKELLNAAANAAKRNQPDIAIKLLEILLPVVQELGSTKGHIHQDAVETRLALFAATPWIQTSKEQNPSGTLDAMKDVHETVRSLISYAWDVVFVRKGLSVALKRATCRWVLIPLLECSSVEIVRGFFSDKIMKIVEGAEKPITLVEGEGLVTRLCAFMLLERMYCLLRKDVLESDILSQLPKKNQTVMKLCVNQAKEIGAPSSDFKELYRQVCCAAFCAASSLLVLTQTNPKFFTLALQGKKGSPPTQLWRNMMAIDQSLSFSVESVGEGSKAQIARASNAVARVEQYTKGHRGGFLGPGATLGNLTFAQTTLSVKIASSQFSLGMEDELPPEKSPRTKQRGMDEAPSTPPRKSLEMAQTTQDIWGGLSNLAQATTPETETANQVLPFYEDQLDKHESMLALVQLIERASEVHCSNDKDLPIWQILISLQSAAVPRQEPNGTCINCFG
ncbi:hypothetical protein BSKO_02290 [Bryopsis sp. KO-2023]|nr:hypothetical protein BSKO_02290 [Bryopsis sp. KO-2023]